MNGLLNVLLIYFLGFPFPFSGTGGCHAGAWHDDVMHAEGLSEAAILTKVLLIFLFGFPLPYSGTGATAPGAWHDEVKHTEGLSKAAVLTTTSF